MTQSDLVLSKINNHLTTLVGAHPVIWSEQHPTQRQKEISDRAWNDILAQMKLTFGRNLQEKYSFNSVEELQHIWNGLKDQSTRVLKQKRRKVRQENFKIQMENLFGKGGENEENQINEKNPGNAADKAKENPEKSAENQETEGKGAKLSQALKENNINLVNSGKNVHGFNVKVMGMVDGNQDGNANLKAENMKNCNPPPAENGSDTNKLTQPTAFDGGNGVKNPDDQESSDSDDSDDSSDSDESTNSRKRKASTNINDLKFMVACIESLNKISAQRQAQDDDPDIAFSNFLRCLMKQMDAKKARQFEWMVIQQAFKMID